MILGMLIGGIAAWLVSGNIQWSRSITLLFSLTIFFTGVSGIWTVSHEALFWGTIEILPLRAWFLLILGLVASMSSWYRWGYGEHGRNVSTWLPLFLLSMATVILANTLWVFMTAWEVMTIASFFLVTTYHEKPSVLKSGYIYLVMSQLSAMLILLGFLDIGTHLHSFNFSYWAQHAHTLSSHTKTGAFIFLGLGFAIKSGVVPFHIWLPYAHPAAPATISSIMSGAMIKLGVFGIVQFLLIDLGPTSHGWALALLALGAITSLLGVLYALMENDIKRLLAYSSIENIGIIVLGIGTAEIGIDGHHPMLITLGLGAALFHSLNHAIIKSQLFFASGAIEQHTGTLDAARLGGLIHTIPGMALGFITGSVAISALPPFNGFVSEWLTLRGLLGLAGGPHILTALYGIILVVALGLTGALSTVCFVKAAGIIFLGQPRQAIDYKPISRHLSGPTLALGMISLILGIFPQIVLSQIPKVISQHLPNRVALASSVHPSLTAGILAVVIAIFVGVSRPWLIRPVPRWAGGRIPDASMQITATSFTKTLRTVFAPLYRPHRKLTKEGPNAPDFPDRMRYQGGTQPIWDHYIYRPAYRLVWYLSHVSIRLQAGPVRLYLVYLLGTVGLMLGLLHAPH